MLQQETNLMKIRPKLFSNKQHRFSLLTQPFSLLSIANLKPIVSKLTTTVNSSMLFHSFNRSKQLLLANKFKLSQFHFRLLPVVMIIIKLLLISMAMFICDALPMSQTSIKQISHRNRTPESAGRYSLQIKNNILDEYQKPKTRTKRFIASDIGAMVSSLFIFCQNFLLLSIFPLK